MARRSRATLGLPVPLLLLALACAQQAPPRPPDIVLVTIESLRPDHLSVYGYERPTMPTLEQLAREAILFENAFAVSSWTLPSHASIFTGLYPAAHGTRRPRDRLKASYDTLAEILSRAGYQTAAIVSGEFVRADFGMQQGFEHFDERAIRDRKRGRRELAEDASPEEEVLAVATNPSMERYLDEFLENVRDPTRPLFLFLYYWDPHYGYRPPAPYDTLFMPADARPPRGPVLFSDRFRFGRDIDAAELRYLQAHYDGELRSTDGYLARAFAKLRERGIWERAAIIVTSDHGEQFFDHGLLGHKHSLYDEELHVPLLLRPPGGVPGRSDSRLVSLVDLFPTILELAGVDHAQTDHGRSLLGDPRSPGDPIYHELLASWYRRQEGSDVPSVDTSDWLAIRRGDEKLIWRDREGVGELYDIARDPGEARALGEEQQDRAARLKAELDRWRESMRAAATHAGPSPQARLSPEDEEQLRALGYLR